LNGTGISEQQEVGYFILSRDQTRITDIFLNVIGASELLSSKPAPEIIASISRSNSALDILSPYRVVSFLILGGGRQNFQDVGVLFYG
ncbi:hypothetical protein, partial [Escherichia coli]|uniref:hypothetical protein n=1 Tax=Escherichia coli TaxID=562 RepID=UPI001ADDA862